MAPPGAWAHGSIQNGGFIRVQLELEGIHIRGFDCTLWKKLLFDRHKTSSNGEDRRKQPGSVGSSSNGHSKEGGVQGKHQRHRAWSLASLGLHHQPQENWEAGHVLTTILCMKFHEKQFASYSTYAPVFLRPLSRCFLYRRTFLSPSES